MTTSSEQFSNLTLNVTKKLTKSEKKAFGIFITPKSIINTLYNTVINYINKNQWNLKRILEPSCGTCEIVTFCDSNLNDVEIDAIEYNETIYQEIKGLDFKNKVNIVNQDFLTFVPPSELYDLVIGNPPYFVCKKEDIPQQYQVYIHGRPNIFGLFILHSLAMVRPGGIVALVIPKSFLNSLYYAKIRNHIKKSCSIVKIDDYSTYHNFIDTEQSTFGLILQKNINGLDTNETECEYSMLFNGNYIFTDNASRLKELFANSKTLEKMGLKVRTGQIVWNEKKDELTDDDRETLLIYNSNISNDNKLTLKTFKNDKKKQYIKRDGRMDPVLVVNRGNGNSAYKLNYAVIKNGPFLTENHLNEIYSPTPLSHKKLLELYEKIERSFKNPKTKNFIEMFLGNNGLSKTELETIFPIYDI